MKKIIVTGATGQIGFELTETLRKKYGKSHVIALAHKKPLFDFDPYEIVDVTDRVALEKIIKKHSPDAIFHLVGILSAAAEKNPELAWDVNINGLKNILDLSLKYKVKKVFWPSSIAAFGPTTPRLNTPQQTILEPTTIYGVTKVTGELLCQYYWKKYALDVRSLRYPGIIQYKAPIADGTTEYACEIFYAAKNSGEFQCFLKQDTVLPMMYINDAVKATIDIMQAKTDKLSVRTSYNLASISFSPKELADEINKHVPLKMKYRPDYHQKIAETWPRTIDDSRARKDWGWKPKFNLSTMTRDILENI